MYRLHVCSSVQVSCLFANASIDSEAASQLILEHEIYPLLVSCLIDGCVISNIYSFPVFIYLCGPTFCTCSLLLLESIPEVAPCGVEIDALVRIIYHPIIRQLLLSDWYMSHSILMYFSCHKK